ncbi:cobalamin-dependent protein [Amycolatopsis mediterranei]|uniref:cobalamin B12-binding domain-containing protein n=1 Tax=Amycolatopsis mediterranei TaxID=33910 RepID=UPI003420717C
MLRLRGFEVGYLGARVPAPHLVAHLHRTGPDAVALSGSRATRLPTAHATITACQAAATPVIAGGAAFGPDGRYARLLGAEAWAPDARAAADRPAEPLPRPHSAHRLQGAHRLHGAQPLDDLPHLVDQEYTLVTRGSGRLVKTVPAGLAERIPAVRASTEPQRRHTAEDLAHIVESLATALYVGDGELFTGFLSWTAGIRTARGVPAASLGPALELLEAERRDFPRATGLLRTARTHLAEPAAGSERPA